MEVEHCVGGDGEIIRIFLLLKKRKLSTKDGLLTWIEKFKLIDLQRSSHKEDKRENGRLIIPQGDSLSQTQNTNFKGISLRILTQRGKISPSEFIKSLRNFFRMENKAKCINIPWDKKTRTISRNCRNTESAQCKKTHEQLIPALKVGKMQLSSATTTAPVTTPQVGVETRFAIRKFIKKLQKAMMLQTIMKEYNKGRGPSHGPAQFHFNNTGISGPMRRLHDSLHGRLGFNHQRTTRPT